MGIWRSLFGRDSSSPEEVRRRLFDAVARADDATLARLAAEHETVVLEHFSAWKSVPEAIRADADAVDAYAQGLIGLAHHFAEARGRGELLAALSGPAESDPILQWQQALSEADVLSDRCEFAAASERLHGALQVVAGLSGTAVDELLPLTLGRLGACCFEVGDAASALAPFQRALALCEAQQDEQGVVAHLGNLYEVHRYLGQAQEAAACLERRAGCIERLGEPARAAVDRSQAALVRAGEPLCRVVAELAGELVEIAQLPPIAERLKFVFRRNRRELRPSAQAVSEGTARAEAGLLAEALGCFQRAAAADRFNPWPSYHAGLTLVHLRRYEEAAQSYRLTEELAPGWYHCRADRWLAKQLAAGKIDHAVFEAHLALEDGGLPPEAALAAARELLARVELGVLRLAAGDALFRLARQAEAEREYRRGLAIAEEPDVKTRLLVALGNCLADAAEKEQLLGEACALRGNLVASAMAEVMLAARPRAALHAPARPARGRGH